MLRITVRVKLRGVFRRLLGNHMEPLVNLHQTVVTGLATIVSGYC